MIILTIILTILLIVVFPGILYVQAARSCKRAMFLIGMAISVFGVFVSDYLFYVMKFFPEYHVTRFLVLVALFLIILAFGIFKLGNNKSELSAFLVVLTKGIVAAAFLIMYLPKEMDIPKEEAKYVPNVEVTTYTKTEKFELLSLKLEDNNGEPEETEDSKIFFGIDRDNLVLYWCFFYRNDKGATEICCLDGEKLENTKIFETLKSGEEPYLEVVSIVEGQADNAISSQKAIENVIKTEYHLYVPNDYLPKTFYLNFN